jgi:hypothetical protein
MSRLGAHLSTWIRPLLWPAALQVPPLLVTGSPMSQMVMNWFSTEAAITYGG